MSAEHDSDEELEQGNDDRYKEIGLERKLEALYKLELNDKIETVTPLEELSLPQFGRLIDVEVNCSSCSNVL